jgi:hypothetical protein
MHSCAGPYNARNELRVGERRCDVNDYDSFPAVRRGSVNQVRLKPDPTYERTAAQTCSSGIVVSPVVDGTVPAGW